MVPEKLCVFLSIGFFSTSSSCISLTEDVASQVIPKACYVQRKINGHGSLWQQVRWISDCTTIFKTEEVENPCHWSERVSSEFLEYVLDCFFFFWSIAGFCLGSRRESSVLLNYHSWNHTSHLIFVLRNFSFWNVFPRRSLNLTQVNIVDFSLHSLPPSFLSMTWVKT